MRGLVVVLTLLLNPFGGEARGEDSREWVVTSADRVGDLYWDGELTDSRGNRWEVDIVPGVRPPVVDGWKAWGEAGDELARYGAGEFWFDRADAFVDGVRFAVVDGARDFVLYGIRDDYAYTSKRLGELARETPFGWIPRMGARTVYGYLVKPTLRVGFGVVGMAGGAAYSVVAPTLGVMGPTASAAGWAAFPGTTLPLLKLAWQQPSFLFSLLNREPSESQHGSWGLRIKGRPEPPKPAARLAFRVVPGPQQALTLRDEELSDGALTLHFERPDGTRVTLFEAARTLDRRAAACGEARIGGACLAQLTTTKGRDVYQKTVDGNPMHYVDVGTTVVRITSDSTLGQEQLEALVDGLTW